MKWRNLPSSTNVEDRRGTGSKMAIGGGAAIIIMLVAALLGGDPGAVLDTLQNAGGGSDTPYVETAEEKELADFVSVVLADTETVFGELRDRFKAPGDFAMAYVVAHEVGHHVQTLLGVTDELQRLRQQLSEAEYNEYSVRFELQADYLAGVWASHAQGRGLLEEGDLEEALKAAEAIGDDRIQREAQGYVVPDSFTHGTSEQRMRWFKKGFDAGNLDDWDTFGAAQL